MTFLHGVETIETTTPTRTIRSVSTAVIGLVGTAPTWQLTAGDRTLNTPVVITSEADAARYFGTRVTGYTIPKALKAIFDQGRAGIIVVVNVFDPATHKTAVVAASYTFDADGNIALPHQGLSTVLVTNVGATTTYTLGTDYTIDVVTGALVRVSTGTIASGATVRVSYNKADPTLVAGTDIIGAVSGGGVRSGAQALLDADPTYGVKPKLLIAPAYSTATTVADALQTLAGTLRGMALIDAPAGTTVATAIAGRGVGGTINFRRTSDRVLLCYPYVSTLDDAGALQLEPLSQRLVGAIARQDIEQGYWYSASNIELVGVKGLERPLTFSLSDTGSEVNQLNAAGICTVASVGGVFRAWGNRSAAYPSASTANVFMSVRRVVDLVSDSLELAALDFLDQPITLALIDAITGTANRFLRTLVSRGALVDGSACRYDVADNPSTEIGNGHLTFRLDLMPPPPLERLTYKSTINIALLSSVE